MRLLVTVAGEAEKGGEGVCCSDEDDDDANGDDADGDDPDDRRTRYLSACLGVASRLRAKGVDLRGYLFWTLMDNFEWAEGFRPRFGLLRTDFATLERHERPSNAVIRAAVAG